MGSVKDPGISDLDIICVFKENTDCQINVRAEISDDEKKILTHALFGVEQNYFQQALNYNLISNLNLLSGDDVIQNLDKSPLNDEIQRQIALEYMFRMFLSLSEQVTYRVVKLRSFLLLGKAIMFDLELLNTKSGKLYDLVNQILNYRSKWFVKQPSQEDLEDLIFSFSKELEYFLEKELNKNNFYLPKDKIKFPEGYSVKLSTEFRYERKGFILPLGLALIGKKYINLQRRFNTVNYFLPFEIPMPESVIYNRFIFGKKLYEINKARYLHFMPLNSSLSIF